MRKPISSLFYTDDFISDDAYFTLYADDMNAALAGPDHNVVERRLEIDEDTTARQPYFKDYQV